MVKYNSTTNIQNPLRRRSLKELDTVFDEMVARNPDFIVKLEKIIEEKLKGG